MGEKDRVCNKFSNVCEMLSFKKKTAFLRYKVNCTC